MDWFFVALRKYAVFSGRARRKEYWFFQLFLLLLILLVAAVAELLGSAAEGGLSVVVGIGFLALVIPSIAVTVRRLHDTGRTGWWILMGFVPFIGDIVLLIFAVLPSQEGENQYGPSPLEA